MDIRKEKRELIVSLTDFHVPYNSKEVNEVSFAFCKLVQPHIIIIHEVMDFYQLSKFDRDPKRKLELQDDLDKSVTLLRRLRQYCPDTRIIMLESNHDRRLKKYLAVRAEELAYLRCLDLKELLHLPELKIEYRKSFVFRGVLFKHGEIVRKFASYTAKNEFEKEGMSIVSGHSHRLGTHFRRLRGGEYVAMESGCQCDLNPDYIDGTADWQNGLSVVGFKHNSKHFYPTVVPIIDGQILWGSKTIG